MAAGEDTSSLQAVLSTLVGPAPARHPHAERPADHGHNDLRHLGDEQRFLQRLRDLALPRIFRGPAGTMPASRLELCRASLERSGIPLHLALPHLHHYIAAPRSPSTPSHIEEDWLNKVAAFGRDALALRPADVPLTDWSPHAWELFCTSISMAVETPAALAAATLNFTSATFNKGEHIGAFLLRLRSLRLDAGSRDPDAEANVIRNAADVGSEPEHLAVAAARRAAAAQRAAHTVRAACAALAEALPDEPAWAQHKALARMRAEDAVSYAAYCDLLRAICGTTVCAGTNTRTRTTTRTPNPAATPTPTADPTATSANRRNRQNRTTYPVGLGPGDGCCRPNHYFRTDSGSLASNHRVSECSLRDTPGPTTVPSSSGCASCGSPHHAANTCPAVHGSDSNKPTATASSVRRVTGSLRRVDASFFTAFCDDPNSTRPASVLLPVAGDDAALDPFFERLAEELDESAPAPPRARRVPDPSAQLDPHAVPVLVSCARDTSAVPVDAVIDSGSTVSICGASLIDRLSHGPLRATFPDGTAAPRLLKPFDNAPRAVPVLGVASLLIEREGLNDGSPAALPALVVQSLGGGDELIIGLHDFAAAGFSLTDRAAAPAPLQAATATPLPAAVSLAKTVRSAFGDPATPRGGTPPPAPVRRATEAPATAPSGEAPDHDAILGGLASPFPDSLGAHLDPAGPDMTPGRPSCLDVESALANSRPLDPANPDSPRIGCGPGIDGNPHLTELESVIRVGMADNAKRDFVDRQRPPVRLVFAPGVDPEHPPDRAQRPMPQRSAAALRTTAETWIKWRVAERVDPALLVPGKRPFPNCVFVNIFATRPAGGKFKTVLNFAPLTGVVIAEGFAQFLPTSIWSNLRRLATRSLFFGVDAKSAYLQIPLRRDASSVQLLFSIPDPDGAMVLFRLTSLPLGLADSPAVFCSLMNRMVSQTAYDRRLASLSSFFDDVNGGADAPVCRCGSAPRHIDLRPFTDLLRALFDGLNGPDGFLLSPAKCFFAIFAVVSCGWAVGHDAITLSPRHRFALGDLPLPITGRQLRGVCGVFAFFEPVHPALAAILETLHKDARLSGALAKHGVDVDDVHRRVATAAALIRDSPTLAAPDFDAPFFLASDYACGTRRVAGNDIRTSAACGAVLFQLRPTPTSLADVGASQVHIVACASKKLPPRRAHIGATPGEALALVTALKKFSHITFGCRVVAISDCMPLVRALTSREATPLLLRHGDVLLNTPGLELVHCAGVDNSLADSLSRIFDGFEFPSSDSSLRDIVDLADGAESAGALLAFADPTRLLDDATPPPSARTARVHFPLATERVRLVRTRARAASGHAAPTSPVPAPRPAASDTPGPPSDSPPPPETPPLFRRPRPPALGPDDEDAHADNPLNPPGLILHGPAYDSPPQVARWPIPPPTSGARSPSTPAPRATGPRSDPPNAPARPARQARRGSSPAPPDPGPDPAPSPPPEPDPPKTPGPDTPVPAPDPGPSSRPSSIPTTPWVPRFFADGCPMPPCVDIVHPWVPTMPLRQPEQRRHRAKFLQLAHGFGHYGRDSLVRLLHGFGLHWPSVDADASRTIKDCQPCSLFAPPRRHAHPLLPSTNLAAQPWSSVAMDAAELPLDDDGYKYFFVIRCRMTLFTAAWAQKTKAVTETVPRLLYTLSLLGLPREVSSDNGSEFVNETMLAVGRALSITHKTSVQYHPSAQGIAEKAVGDVLEALRRMCNGDPSHWSSVLPAVVFAINARFAESRGSSPFTLFFARDPLPLGDYSGSGALVEASDADRAARLAELDNLRDRVFPRLLLRMGQTFAARAAGHARRLGPPRQFAVGDTVMAINDLRSSKFEPRMIGPFRVAYRSNNDTFLLLDSNAHIISRRFNSDKLEHTGRPFVFAESVRPRAS
jgi:hypothetical protein